MNKPVDFETFLNEQLKDPEFKKEYDALEEEFEGLAAACENASSPDKALRDAVSHAREQGPQDTSPSEAVGTAAYES